MNFVTQRLYKVARVVTDYELLFLLLTAPLFIFGSPLRPLTLVVLAAIGGSRWIARRRLSARSAADLPVLVLLTLMLLSLWVTPLPHLTRYVFFILLFNLAIFNSVLNWANAPARIWLTVIGLIAVATGLCVLAPFSVAWFTDRKLMFMPRAIYRAMPTVLTDTIHPNIMAGALVIILPIPFALSLFGFSSLPRRVARWARPITTFATILIFTIIVLSKSRGAYIAAAVAVGVLLIWRDRRWLWGLPVVLLLALGSVWRLGGRVVWDVLTRSENIGGWDVRLELWQRAVQMIGDFPFTGIGLGMFEQTTAVLYPAFTSRGLPHAHQFLLQAGVDLGLGGLLAYGAVVLIALISAGRAASALGRYPHDAPHNADLARVARGCFASLIALIVHGLVDATQWDSKVAFISWGLFGLSFALWRWSKLANQQISKWANGQMGKKDKA